MIFSDISAAFRWWLVLMLLGAAAWPFAGWLFHRLPDRGYAVAKMLGLLVTSFIFWLAASLGLVGNGVGGILLGFTALAGLSVWAWRRQSGEMAGWLRTNWRYALLVEILFLAIFALWAVVRAQNPSITATEKPMDFAFLNAATFSPTYPPLDPWLSGFAISYYYFGYVMVSVIGRLAAVSPAVGYNLGLAWLVAGTALGAFSLVFNLTARKLPDQEPDQKGKTGGASRLALSQTAVIVALLAAVAIPLAGNGQMLLEILHGNGFGTAALWDWLDVRDVNEPPRDQPRFLTAGGEPTASWWWWRASRPIHEHHLSGRVEEGLEPIAEFPAFSFILGDMHPHVLALPFALLSLALALNWYLDNGRTARRNEEAVATGLWAWLGKLFRGENGLRFVMAAVIVGGLSFLNTWDVLIHLFILVGAVVLARWRLWGWSNDRLVEGFTLAIVLIAMAYALYLPFYLGFSSQAGPPFILPMLMRPTRLVQFGIIFGRPLLIILPFLLLLAWRQPFSRQGLRAALTAGLGLPLLLAIVALLLTFGLAAHALAYGPIGSLAAELEITLPPRSPTATFDWSWASAALGGLLPVYLQARLRYAGLTLLLAALLGLVVYIWYGRFSSGKTAAHPLQTDPGRLPFALLLILTAALLTLGPEFVYLRDNFGQRLNTIFKFYYQAWLFFGIGASVGLAWLIRRARPLGWSAGAVYTTLLAIALLFPIQAVQSRAVEYRGPADAALRQPPTLNGLAFLNQVNPSDYEAIRWLAANVPPGTVVLEASGSPYSYFARISANTGLPTVLGWANHQFQWRGNSTPEPGNRIPLVADIYNTRDWIAAAELLNRFDVDYIVVGSLEKQEYDPRGLEKFSANLPVAFANDAVTVYHWQP